MSAESTSKKRLELSVRGIVQGVGFRPFIYQRALGYSLKGHVLNNGKGVVVEIEGEARDLDSFLDALTSQTPPLSRIDSLSIKEIALQNTADFTIIESHKTDASTMLSADISICEDCKREMNDPNDRRYKYPFINCTNCGPRYTIINTLPYDRKNTSMQKFEMCEKCRAEYEDPMNRRFHAQPVSCFECGPKLSLSSLSEEEIREDEELLENLAQEIRDGKTVALHGIGGFHIICDATNDEALQTLRLSKNRPTKPFAVMFQDIESVKKVADLSERDEEMIRSKERPIVIVSKKRDSHLSSFVAPNIDRLGVFLPYTPLHELLLEKLNFPIVATSANLSDEPIIRDKAELLEKLPFVVQDVLSHNREIINACDDSVMFTLKNQSVMMRLSRGYAPRSFTISQTEKKILALGAHQKSSITLAFDEHMILSPHIGDLGSIGAFEYYLRTLETFKCFYDFEPDTIVCDMHPNYESSKWAKSYVLEHPNVKLVEVQHHYAHALSCMAEYGLDGEYLAFCFDGTGYGEESTLWGGEVLKVTAQSYERLYHLEEFSLLGADKAVKEPRRVALALLFECFSLDEICEMESELVNSFSKEELHNLHLMQTKGLNSPRSSSMGRLFDAVYALSGNLQDLAYEGESGLIIERMAKEYPSQESYSYSIVDGVISYKEMLFEMMQEQEKNLIAAKFINTLVSIILELAKKHPKHSVILSGGVFQNKTLLERVSDAFEQNKVKYYIQSQTPINDGGISFGQAYYALHHEN